MADDEGAPVSGSRWGFGRSSFSTNLKIGGLDDATAQLKGLTSTLTQLTSQLTSLNQQQTQLSSGLTNMMKAIGNSAASANTQVQALGSSVSNVRSGSGITNALFAGASAAAGSDIFKDLAMFPLRYTTSALDTNRQLAMNVSAGLGGQMYATGATSQQMLGQLGRFPGNVMGSTDDLLNLMQIARSSGAMLDLGATARNANQGSNRTVGFLRGVAEAQQISPGTPVGQIAQTIGGYAADVGAQKASALYTGGAYSMIAQGGRQRSLSEWAESIMKWLIDLRPGDRKGKPFSYGELMAQYFPGSNIDAWFNLNGVPEGMKEYWWDYALNKSRSTGAGTTITAVNQGAAGGGNQAYERLQAISSQTRGSFGLASAMSGTYSNKEQANRWFNDLMAQVQTTVLPSQVSRGGLQALQYLPDALQELMMGLLERSGSIGAVIGGGLGYGITGAKSLGTNLMQMLTGGLNTDIIGTNSMSSWLTSLQGSLSGIGSGGGLADQIINGIKDLLPGDVGDTVDGIGGMGYNSLGGLHPDMRRKLGAMMRANPRLRITSSRRDEVNQQNLRAKGYSNVSGKSSAHTRGHAADLGPSSQYGWIMSNARKFGLKSGAGVGEPWHVGLGDPVDSNTNSGAIDLGALLNLFTGGMNKEGVTGAIGNAVPGIMRLFFGLFGMDEGADTSNLAFDPNVYNLLRGTGAYTIGGLQGSPGGSIGSWFNSLWSGGGGGGGGGGSTGTTDLAASLRALGMEPGSLSAGAMVAKLAYQAGFRGESLAKAVGVAKRESSWNPMAHNPNPPDDSYGLMQINMLGNLGPARREQYGLSANTDLYDPYKNLSVAYDMSGQGSNWSPWTINGNSDARVDFPAARTAIREAGLGDIDTPGMRFAVASGAGGHTTMHFNNTFVVQSGGSGGGIDVRRAVSQIATQLEGEMNKRLARRN